MPLSREVKTYTEEEQLPRRRRPPGLLFHVYISTLFPRALLKTKEGLIPTSKRQEEEEVVAFNVYN